MSAAGSGTIDSTFNSGGTGTNGLVYGLALQPDGKIIVGGTFTGYNGSESTPAHVIRLLGESNTANQTITVNTHAPANAAYGTSFMVAATSNSGLPVTYSSAGACTNNGATFTMTSGIGTCTVKYDQAGNNDYNPAPQVTETVTAQKADQTISFGAPADKTFGDADFTLSATATSGLAVSFAVSGQCTVSGATVDITGAGSCTVTASQAGNANYNAAADVQRSFLIAKAATSVAVGSSANPSAPSQSVTFTATVTSAAGTPTGSVQFKADGANLGSPVLLSAGGVATLTTSAPPAGNHTVTAEYGGDANFATSSGTLAGGQTVGSLFEFSQSNYAVNERDGAVAVTVRRLGDATQAAAVEYATDDGSVPSVAVPCSSVTGLALERCDYTRAQGLLQFAPGGDRENVLRARQRRLLP